MRTYQQATDTDIKFVVYLPVAHAPQSSEMVPQQSQAAVLQQGISVDKLLSSGGFTQFVVVNFRADIRHLLCDEISTHEAAGRGTIYDIKGVVEPVMPQCLLLLLFLLRSLCQI